MNFKQRFAKQFAVTAGISMGLGIAAMAVMAGLAANSGDYDAMIQFAGVGVAATVVLGVILGLASGVLHEEGTSDKVIIRK